MCTSCGIRLSRRAVLQGLVATAGLAALASAAGAATPAACWNPSELAGTLAEKAERRPTAADAFLMPTPAAAVEPVPAGLAGVVRRVSLPAGHKTIALTFDLCQTVSPIAGYDAAIVDYLRANLVPATFFPSGRWLETHRERAAELVGDPLFVVGNHSFDHPDLHNFGADKVTAEILLTEASLVRARAAASARCGRPIAAPAMRLFRFPYGSCAANGIADANAIGSVVIQWDVVSGDPDGTSAGDIVRNVMREVKPGSISVMHANGRGTHTAEALAILVPKLRTMGYTFATVPALLAAGVPEAASACYIEKPGDTARYDDKLARHAKPAATGKAA
jgi:peptidoglycan/xylan/chitin deacetylase (PgdA/CDA1 family)